MAPHFSVRDVQFTDFDYDVLITVTTDIPCHLWCRLTLEEPQIHIVTTKRRGVIFNSELRFCFVAYEDNEQRESGDTTTHTWMKPNWPFCTTKYCYFWGYVSSVLAKSGSPFFKHHNDKVPAVHFSVGDPAINYGDAGTTNQVVLVNDAPSTGAGWLKYLELYASPHPNDNLFYVAVMHHVAVDDWQVRAVYQAYCDTQGVTKYVINMPCGLGDCLAIWGFYGGIRRKFSLTLGKRSMYYGSNPLIVNDHIIFDQIGYEEKVALYADNYSIP